MRRWAGRTPPGFRFAPKLNAHPRAPVAAFGRRLAALGDRLGPARLLVRNARDDALLARLLGALPSGTRVAWDLAPPVLGGGAPAPGHRGRGGRGGRRGLPVPAVARAAVLGGRAARVGGSRSARWKATCSSTCATRTSRPPRGTRSGWRSWSQRGEPGSGRRVGTALAPSVAPSPGGPRRRSRAATAAGRACAGARRPCA